MIKVVLDKYALSQAFSAKVRKLSSFQEIIKRNKTRIDPDICHSHDFCDANELMLEAWAETFKVEPNFGYEPHLALISDAWDIAKENEFFHAYPERFSHLKAEFKDFDVFTLPAIPDGWEDRSWHNDSCPTFGIIEKDDYALMLYVDFADDNLREIPGGPRFSLIEHLDLGKTNNVIDTDDFDAVLKAIKTAEKKDA